MQRVHVKRRRRRHKTWSEVSNELGVLLGALRPLRTVEQRGHDDHLVRGRVRARVRVRGRGRGRHDDHRDRRRRERAVGQRWPCVELQQRRYVPAWQ